jgi:hypothetical protein
LLNMLIKNEREHLDRTLPKWAKIIDCWIIGVDDANTDDSAEVIMKVRCAAGAPLARTLSGARVFLSRSLIFWKYIPCV